MSGNERRFAWPGAIRGGTVRGRLLLPEGRGPFAWVVQVHGYTSSGEWGFHPELARRLVARGIAALRFEFSGDGRDEAGGVDRDVVGRGTYVGELADLAVVRAWARSQPELDADRAALVGHSRGGAMGLLHAAEAGGYRTVVGWAAMHRILNFAVERLDRWRREGRIDILHHGLGERVLLDVSVLESAERHAARLDILAAVRRLAIPLLILQGRRDLALPASCAEQLVAASPHPETRLRWIEAAGHVFGAREPMPDPFPERLETLLTETVDWLCLRLHPQNLS